MNAHHHHTRATPAQSDPTGPTTTTQPDVTSGTKDHNAPVTTAEAVQLRAYRKWESAGKPAGNDIAFWLEAEKELAQGK
jgi:Protein of unknown function (DUF2934)